MVANYTNKHITFNKGQCIGHMEPTIDRMSQILVNSVTTQKMMDDQVQPDNFTPPLHCLPLKVQCSLDELLDSFKTQFAKDEIEHWHDKFDEKCRLTQAPLTPVLQKQYPIAMKHYDWVKDEIDRLF